MHGYKYKVETHLHTSQASACGCNTGAEMAKGCKKAGYCAIVVTDHFFNGNTAIHGNYIWDERVSLFMKGYEDAKQKGDKIGLDVYFGFEFCSRGTEFLIYNFGEENLRAYPEIMGDSTEKVLTRIKNEGGFIIHAHPYRVEPYIWQPGRQFPEYIDAVEVINTSNKLREYNRQALEYAQKYNLIQFSGSDTHWNSYYEGGLAFERKPESLSDIINMVKENKYITLGEQFLYD
ncbi:MAG: PHP domain-containing protein [Oscillospiraceae bacterium]|nr:PHP domain-containing protein [Oscillospiraceae bacterium]